MAWLTQVPQFTHQQINLFRYGYEKVPYTAYDPALSQSGEILLNNENVAADTGGTALAVVSDWASTPVASVRLAIQNPRRTTTWHTVAFPAALQPIQTGTEQGTRSTGLLRVTVENNTGSALGSAFQVNYAGALVQLSVADKVLRGIPLTEAEKALAQKYGLGKSGSRPLTFAEMRQHVFERAILDERIVTQDLTITAGSPGPTLGPFTPDTPNELLVLHEIATSLPSGSVGNEVVLSLDRDNQKGRAAWLLDNSPGLAVPWDCWIAAQSHIDLTTSTATTTDSVIVRLAFYRIRKTTLVQAFTGTLMPTTAGERSLLEQVQAGVLG